MPRGGAQENAGRKHKWKNWGRKTTRLRIPTSVSHDLMGWLEDLHDQGISIQEALALLQPQDICTVRRYLDPVVAGSGNTSRLGGGALSVEYETIQLPHFLVDNPEKTIMMPVVGDSMVEVGIYPGTWLIVEEIDPLFERPKEGQIVIVSVNDEVMVKRYKTKNGKVILLSENSNYEPIEDSEGSQNSIYISGIVRHWIQSSL